VDPEDLAILDGVIGLSVAFRRRVIAEGVETAAHGQLLLRLGCDWGQGYAIAKPMPAQDIPAWLAAWTPDTSWKHTPRLHREDLPLLFAAVEVRAWVDALVEHIKGRRVLPPEGDPTLCHFGRWLGDAQGGQRYADHVEYPELVALHDELHHRCDALMTLPSDEALGQLAPLFDVRDRLHRCLERLESVA
jgi:hypothetical protein